MVTKLYRVRDTHGSVDIQRVRIFPANGGVRIKFEYDGNPITLLINEDILDEMIDSQEEWEIN